MEYALPHWLLEATGDPVEPQLLWSDSKHFILSSSNEPDQFFATAEEAYDAADSSAIKLDASVTNDLGAYFGALQSGTSRMLMSTTDDDRLWELEQELFSFIDEINARYLREPDNFMASYNFLDSHPAFWTRTNPAEPIAHQNWQMLDRLSEATIHPYENGTVTTFHIELGETAPPDYTHTYFDPDLSDQAPTYEEVIIVGAQRIHEVFWPTGERKENMSAEEFEAHLKRLQKLDTANVAERRAIEDPYL